MTMVTNERNTNSGSSKLVPIALEKTSSKINEVRNETLDIVKIIARDSDQANSANNLIKKLYYYVDWISQLVASYYLGKNGATSSVNIDNKEHSVTISTNVRSPKKEVDRVDTVISSVLLGKEISICGGSEGFQEDSMVKLLKSNFTVNGIKPSDIKDEILSAVGNGKYKVITRDDISMADVLPYLSSLKENVNSLVNSN